jgi:hypothetical protein
MSFATPLAFALAAVAIPIVLFYILKVRLRRMPVSTNLFWKQLYDEKPPRSIWQYLRHLLSLLAQLLLVVLLVLAVADPYLPWQLLQARRIVAVIDNSASMRAADVQPSRFDAAVEAALATAEGLRFRDQMAIVLAGPEPEVIVGMIGHVPTLKRALRSIEVSDNPTELDSAIELGQQLIGEHPHGEVVVFTDGCERNEGGAMRDEGKEDGTSDSSLIPPPSSLQRRVFGTAEASNVGITQFQVRRSLIDPLGYEVLAVVKNASDHPVIGRLELELDGVPVDVLPLDLEPDGVFTRSLEKTSLEGGTLVARLTEVRLASEDDEPEQRDAQPPIELNALQTDDQAWAVLPPREIQNLLIVTSGNLFLRKAFEANPLARVTVQKEFPETWPSGSIIVLHRDVPAMLPPGDVFIVDPRDDCDVFEVGDLIENPIITEQDEDSPLMTHVRLDNVVMPEARRLTLTEPPRVLAGSVSGDPVYAEVKRTDGKCLVLSVDIDKGDLAFRTAFPIMVANSLGWFAGQTGELRPSLATGSMTEVHLLEDQVGPATELSLRSPSGKSQPLAIRGKGDPAEGEANSNVSEPYVSIPAQGECGIWSIVRGVDEAAETIAELAVNLADESETDLRPPDELIDDKTTPLVAGWFTRPIWFYLATVACLLTVGEWWLYQRRVIT